MNVLDSELGARLHLEIEIATEQTVVERIPVAGNIQPLGLLHGGANAFLVEDAASRLALLNADEGYSAVGTELNLSQLRPNTSSLARATATVLRKGRTTFVANVEITDANDRVTAVGRLSCIFVPRRPSNTDR